MKFLLVLIVGLALAVHDASGSPTDHDASCRNKCVVCETSCKTVDCGKALGCCCQMKHHNEHQCPKGFTWNGAKCMQDYSSQISVKPPCCCVC
uniref:Uncharacterized protein n=1 Tax=Anopheles funestus TaxID=62324 RepID=A0A182RDH2_ANOFN